MKDKNETSKLHKLRPNVGVSGSTSRRVFWSVHTLNMGILAEVFLGPIKHA